MLNAAVKFLQESSTVRSPSSVFMIRERSQAYHDL